MSDQHKIVQTGCSTCQKHFGTVEQFKRHITEDVLPSLLDTLPLDMNSITILQNCGSQFSRFDVKTGREKSPVKDYQNVARNPSSPG
jgi:hypothetical protein